MSNILKNKISNETKSTKQLYGYALRDKFTHICQADLVSKVLNKTENIKMLSRSDEISTEHIGQEFAVYNGIHKYILNIKANMVGFKVGEFVASRKIKNLNDDHKFKLRKFDKFKKKEIDEPLNNVKSESVTDKLTVLQELSKRSLGLF